MCSWHEQLPNVIGVGPQWATANVRQKATVVCEVRGSRSNKRLMYESSSRMLCYVNGKCRFVERINARNLSTTATPLMRYVSQLRHESLCCSEAVDIQDDDRTLATLLWNGQLTTVD